LIHASAALWSIFQRPAESRRRRAISGGHARELDFSYNPPPYWPFSRHTVSDDLQAELERLRAENERLKKSGRGKLALKVSEKGALSVYGMGRFPVTLYKEQWLKLLGMAEEIKAFIEANNDSLKSKE